MTAATTGCSVRRQRERRTGEAVAIIGSMVLATLSLPVRRAHLREPAIRSVRRFATPLEGGERRDPGKKLYWRFAKKVCDRPARRH